ncbi:hypothetical protein [Agrobacterium sp.]|uniref:hypothetical protein n=1 Tax=Agrobacterium sp. TaxID=361 RepID=UPI00289A74AF|nr:hypothetical protein [Agrobacterium sp.]
MVYKAFFPVLLALTLLTIAVITFPELAMIAAISIVGIPIALAMWAAPSLLLICVLFLIIYRFVPLHGLHRVFLSIALVLTTLSLVPLLLNLPIHMQAREWIAGDLNNIVLPLNARVIGIRQTENECDEFCIRALLTGTADKIIVTRTDMENEEADPQRRAIAFRFERRPACPEIKEKFNSNWFAIPNEDQQRPLVRPNDVVNLKASQGLCFIWEEATLTEADLVISRQEVKRRGYSMDGTLLKYDDVLSAYRMSAHVREAPSTTFREIYRHTEVYYRSFGYFMLPVPTGSGWVQELGWWQTSRKLNASDRRKSPEDAWGEFLTETLGLNLKLEIGRIEEEIVGNIESAIKARRTPTTGEWKAYADYHDSLLMVSELSKQVFDLQLKILADPSFPPPPRLNSLAQNARENERAALLVLASGMFKRALAGTTWADSFGVSKEQSLSNLSSGIAVLPDKTLEPYFAELVRLSRIPEARTTMTGALTKLHVFGDAAVPAMLDLMEAGLIGREVLTRDGKFQQPYLAGLQGLCLAGESASSALPRLREWVSMRRLPMNSEYGDMLVVTMAKMGAQPQELWEAYSKINSGRKRHQFIDHVNNSLSSTRDCQF